MFPVQRFASSFFTMAIEFRIVFFFLLLFLYVIIRVINSWLKCPNLSVSMNIGYFTLSVRFTSENPTANWMNECAFLLKVQKKTTSDRPHLRNAQKWWLSLLKIQLISVIIAICSIIMSFFRLFYYFIIGYNWTVFSLTCFHNKPPNFLNVFAAVVGIVNGSDISKHFNV